MSITAASTSDIKRRDAASRLIVLAIDMLDEEPEQIVRDYLDHALGALQRVRQVDRSNEKEGNPK